MTQTIVESLQHSKLFAHLDPEKRQALANQSTIQEFEAGDLLIQEKDEVSALYLLVAGSVNVTTNSMNREVALQQLTPSAFFGEVSLLSGKQATATVRAGQQGARCIMIPKDVVTTLIKEDETLRETLEGITLARAKDTIAKVLN